VAGMPLISRLIYGKEEDDDGTDGAAGGESSDSC
jgi:hypothetical protein